MANVKKLSVKTVHGAINLKTLIEKGSIKVGRFMGTAVGSKKGMTGYGEYTALLGNFAGINAETGEINRAATLFLPDVALIPILTALSAPGSNGVEFAIDVSAEYVADKEGYKQGGSVYEYRFDHVLDMGADDPVARLQAKIAAQEQAKLPAPGAETVTPPEPAQEKKANKK